MIKKVLNVNGIERTLIVDQEALLHMYWPPVTQEAVRERIATGTGRSGRSLVSVINRFR